MNKHVLRLQQASVTRGYAANGIALITILEAKAAGYWPLENAEDLLANCSSYLCDQRKLRPIPDLRGVMSNEVG